MDIRGIQIGTLWKRLTQHQWSQILDLSPIVQAVVNSRETRQWRLRVLKFEARLNWTSAQYAGTLPSI
jgi:hypothetical protein